MYLHNQYMSFILNLFTCMNVRAIIDAFSNYIIYKMLFDKAEVLSRSALSVTTFGHLLTILISSSSVIPPLIQVFPLRVAFDVCCVF